MTARSEEAGKAKDAAPDAGGAVAVVPDGGRAATLAVSGQAPDGLALRSLVEDRVGFFLRIGLLLAGGFGAGPFAPVFLFGWMVAEVGAAWRQLPGRESAATGAGDLRDVALACAGALPLGSAIGGALVAVIQAGLWALSGGGLELAPKAVWILSGMVAFLPFILICGDQLARRDLVANATETPGTATDAPEHPAESSPVRGPSPLAATARLLLPGAALGAIAGLLPDAIGPAFQGAVALRVFVLGLAGFTVATVGRGLLYLAILRRARSRLARLAPEPAGPDAAVVPVPDAPGPAPHEWIEAGYSSLPVWVGASVIPAVLTPLRANLFSPGAASLGTVAVVGLWAARGLGARAVGAAVVFAGGFGVAVAAWSAGVSWLLAAVRGVNPLGIAVNGVALLALPVMIDRAAALSAAVWRRLRGRAAQPVAPLSVVLPRAAVGITVGLLLSEAVLAVGHLLTAGTPDDGFFSPMIGWRTRAYLAETFGQLLALSVIARFHLAEAPARGRLPVGARALPSESREPQGRRESEEAQDPHEPQDPG